METSNNTHHPPAVQQQLQNALAASLDDDSSDDDIPTSHHLPACRRKKKGDKLNALKQGTIANLNGFDKASYGITSSSLRKGSVVHTKLKPGWEDRNDKKWKNSKLVKENYPLLNEKTGRFNKSFEKYPTCLLLAAEDDEDLLTIMNWWITALTKMERQLLWDQKKFNVHFRTPTTSAEKASLLIDANSAAFVADNLPDHQYRVISTFDDPKLQRAHVETSANKRTLDTVNHASRNSYRQSAQTDGQLFDRNSERREDQLFLELKKLHIATRKEENVVASFDSRIIKKKLEPADLYVTGEDGTRKKRKGPRQKNAGMVTRFECTSRNKNEGLGWIDELYQAKQNGQIVMTYTDDFEDPPDNTDVNEDGRPISPVSVIPANRLVSVGFSADDLVDFD